jgi:predicted heme/steroid binding protein
MNRSAKVIITPMERSDHIDGIIEIHRSSGDGCTRMYIPHVGFGCDVTGCLHWKCGLHEGLHFLGQGLYAELGEVLLPQEAFKRSYLTVVGRLESLSAIWEFQN